MKFRALILASMISLVLAVVTGAVLTVSAAIDRAARRDLDRELARSIEVLGELQGYRASLYAAQADLIAQAPRVKAVVHTTDIDHATILDSAREFQRSAGADLLLLTDGAGILRADVSDPEAEGYDLHELPVIAGALRDGAAAAILVDAEHRRAHQVHARTLSFGDEIFGVIVLGFVIDDRVAATIERQTGADVLFTLEDQILAASSLTEVGGDPQGILAALAGASLTDDRTHALTIAGRPLLARGGPIPGSRDDQALRFVILRSLDQALADSRAIITQLLGVAALAVLIALLIAMVIARRLARPLDRLVAHTQAIAGGTLAPRPPPSSPRELRTLGEAMNHMVGELAESRANLAAKQRLEDELEIAARIQTSIVPTTPTAEGLEIAAIMRPATEVGGDYYDVITADDHGVWIGIGDVAGHGLRAGLVMLMVQSAIASLVRRDPEAAPSALVAALNRTIYDNVRLRLDQDEHVTLTLLRYEHSGRLRFAGAHEPLLIIRGESGACEEVPTPGTWVGVLPEIDDALIDSERALDPGDLLILYSDGLIESRDPQGAIFGLDRVRELAITHRQAPVAELAALLVDASVAWRTAADDDITVVVLRVTGA